MKKLELEKTIKEKELELEKLKKELEHANNVSLVFEPKLKEVYYLIEREGYFYCYTNNDGRTTQNILKNNLVYPTEELVRKAIDKQQAKIRVIKEIARLNDGWIPDWEDSEEGKHSVYYNHLAEALYTKSPTYLKDSDNNLYLKSIELAEQLIETHREDLLLMLEVE